METSSPLQKDVPSRLLKQSHTPESPDFSIWAIILIIFGILLVVGGIISMVALEDRSGGWVYTVVLIGSGIQCFFCSFMVGVFTDIRWYLKKLVEKTKDRE